MQEFSVELVEKSPKSNGCSATFVRINEQWGLKYWCSGRTYYCGGEYINSIDMRNEEHRKLNFASKHGLAPKVGEKITFELGGFTYDGFFVEILEYTYKERYLKLKDLPEYVNGSYLYDFDYSMSGEDSTGLINIGEELLNIGFSKVDDIHHENVGFMPDGSFVVIDLGHCVLPEHLE